VDVVEIGSEVDGDPGKEMANGDETTSHKRKETDAHRFSDKTCGRWGQKNQPQVEKIFQFSDSKVRFHMKSHGSNAAT